MRLEKLRVEGFRNLEALQLELPGGLLVFHGANGQGKTSLVEAAYLLASTKSFRTHTPAEMVASGSMRRNTPERTAG